MKKYAKIWNLVQMFLMYSKVFKSMQNYAKLCKIMQNYATVYKGKQNTCQKKVQKQCKQSSQKVYTLYLAFPIDESNLTNCLNLI